MKETLVLRFLVGAAGCEGTLVIRAAITEGTLGAADGESEGECESEAAVEGAAEGEGEAAVGIEEDAVEIEGEGAAEGEGAIEVEGEVPPKVLSKLIP